VLSLILGISADLSASKTVIGNARVQSRREDCMAEPQVTRRATGASISSADFAGNAPVRLSRSRRALAWTACAGGLLAYNWWVLVPFKRGLMTSPNELFSNLEITGQPYAAIMQHLDVLAGVLLLGAFLATGLRSLPAGHRDWAAMLVFAAAGLAGGLFPEVCADGINAVCRREEWHFQLPTSQYVHMVAGIFEFAAITIALFVAMRRTRGSQARTARIYRRLWQAALVCYPLLGLAYLLNRMGGVMEGVFFVGFTTVVVTQVAERTGHGAGSQLAASSAGTASAGYQPCGSTRS
jgi:Protein of unknown function (DUF998)